MSQPFLDNDWNQSMIVMEISVISLEKLLVLHCSRKWKLFPNALYVPASPLLLPRIGLQNNSSSVQLLQRPVQLRSFPQTRQIISFGFSSLCCLGALDYFPCFPPDDLLLNIIIKKWNV